MHTPRFAAYARACRASRAQPKCMQLLQISQTCAYYVNFASDCERLSRQNFFRQIAHTTPRIARHNDSQAIARPSHLPHWEGRKPLGKFKLRLGLPRTLPPRSTQPQPQPPFSPEGSMGSGKQIRVHGCRINPRQSKPQDPNQLIQTHEPTGVEKTHGSRLGPMDFGDC